MLLQGVLLFVLLGEVYSTFVKINGTTSKHRSRVDVCYEPDTTTKLECHLDTTIQYPGLEPTWSVVRGSTSASDFSYGTDPKSKNSVAVYTFMPHGTPSLVLTCGCDSNLPPCITTVTIALDACQSTTSSMPSTSSSTSSSTHHTQSTTTPTEPPTHHTSGSTANQGSTTKKPNKFKGVNPLIYTVIAVFLLGTLAVVAIVTCWIRARKTFYRRHRLPQFTTPRDYFDGISDSDFTPLTANQFYASLRDAPPTYHESEVIQASLREDEVNRDSSNDQSPPPLPPRNLNSSSHRNVSPSDGGESAQQSEQHTSPARQVDDEAMLVPSTGLPTNSPSLPSDLLLL